jgi:membrane-bound ClpP family serine protease
MNAVVLLLLIGIVLVALEVFMPGAVLGVIGVITLLGGGALAYFRFGPAGGTIASAVALALLGITLYAEFKLLPQTSVGRKLFMRATVHATSQPPPAEAAVVGRSGTALTTLAPSGYVLVDGQRYEAYSQSGHLTKGTPLRVVGLDNFRLIVSKIPPS